MITTTLKKLRTNGACIHGYNKLVRSLKGEEFTSKDHERKSYIRFAHTDDIGIDYIAQSNGIEDAAWSLRASNCSERDARLFAVWCAREVKRLMNDSRSIDAIDIAEKFANGNELYAARAVARAAAKFANGNSTNDELDAEWDAEWDAAWDAAGAKQKEILIKMCNNQAPWQVKND